MPQSTTKLGWSVKMRSMQDMELGNIWVKPDISCWKPWKLMNAARQVPSMAVLSLTHHEVALESKSPSITVNNGLNLPNLFKRLSKLF